MGFSIDLQKAGVTDELYRKYQEFDFDAMRIGAEEFLVNAERDNNIFRGCIEKFVEENSFGQEN
jgi:hypothetical protein